MEGKDGREGWKGRMEGKDGREEGKKKGGSEGGERKVGKDGRGVRREGGRRGWGRME